MRLIRLGTRASALARWQSEHVAARFAAVSPDVEVTIVEIESAGDRITDVPLSHVEGTGFFTAALERALLAGEVDVAVHSYKDLPIEFTPGLVVAAVPARGPVEDVLCARDGLRIDTLPPGARIGTCSARRSAQVRAMRPDLSLQSLRGNVPTRVGRVTGGELDAIVLARAGLVRLGLDRHITEMFATDRMLPAPAQGALAVQCRAGDGEKRGWLARLDDEPTRRAVDAERTLLHALGGGCSVPVGAVARCAGRDVTLTAGVFGVRTATAVRLVIRGQDARVLGETAASRLLALGAGDLLSEFNRTARVEASIPARVQ
jgi:hydroxymethylbilane synthase